MEISLNYQIIVFVISIVLGVTLGFIFDFFKVVGLILGRGELKTFIIDVLYFIFCAFISFLYMMVVSSGEIRIFYIIGEVAGWFLYHFTLGKYIFSIWTKLVFFLKKKCFIVVNLINKFIKKHSLKNFFKNIVIKKKSLEK